MHALNPSSLLAWAYLEGLWVQALPPQNKYIAVIKGCIFRKKDKFQWKNPPQTNPSNSPPCPSSLTNLHIYIPVANLSQLNTKCHISWPKKVIIHFRLVNITPPA